MEGWVVGVRLTQRLPGPMTTNLAWQFSSEQYPLYVAGSDGEGHAEGLKLSGSQS